MSIPSEDLPTATLIMKLIEVIFPTIHLSFGIDVLFLCVSSLLPSIP